MEWVTRLRQFFGVDDVDVTFDEHLGELALVLLRVSAARIRPLDHDAGVVDRQAVDDIGIAAGEDPIGARHHFGRRESPFVDQPSMNLGRLQEFVARRRGDANEFEELIPPCFGGRIRALILDQRHDLRIVGDLLRGSDHRCRNRCWRAGFALCGCSVLRRRGRAVSDATERDDDDKDPGRCETRVRSVRLFHCLCCLGGVSENGLGLEELLEAVDAPFAAVARLLVAAERRVEVDAGAPLRWTLPVRSREATRRARSRSPDET